ncbi:HD domain-containing protein [Pseudomarimonas arenosa]|uniref:Metal-dependent HD superfamily phosphohydrolase n=1 Tax=Pseudomarimonas arenosa TaxID=2774145 RepID=A0AAW3ZSC2_9GAMM|nr:hypothetical protein [Pseudomarimonas arenosa]MBD8527111.1 hypothetical protein [Pseudomarimonas arenosa]
MRELVEQWRGMAGRLALRHSEELLDELLRRYQEPQRVFHRLTHLQQVLRGLRWAQGPDWLQLAAWFHDAVYRPGQPWNERRSAALARRRLSGAGLPESGIERIAAAVLSTTGHCSAGVDADLLLDADLSVLGSTTDAYATYRTQLAEEYRCLPVSIYRHGRKAFLRGMLARQSIFRSRGFRLRYEAKARANLAMELRQLERGD